MNQEQILVFETELNHPGAGCARSLHSFKIPRMGFSYSPNEVNVNLFIYFKGLCMKSNLNASGVSKLLFGMNWGCTVPWRKVEGLCIY